MRSLATSVIAGVAFPLHELAKGHRSVSLRRELERTQWLADLDVRKLQLANLRKFLAAAMRGVPYYQRLFAEHSFVPDSIASVNDLARLPLLTKSVIRDNMEAMTSRGAARLSRSSTGGSTGEPLVFYTGVERVSHDVAAKWRATRWWNVDIGDPEVVLWGSPVELNRQDRIKTLRDRILRSHLLPAFQMSVAHMDLYVERIVRLRPRMLFGYASALALLAQHAEERGHRLANLGIRVAFATGETLYAQQREIISRVFGCPVANGYGSREAGFIAHECPQGTLHLSAEHVIVEILDEDARPAAPGESGEVVVTHLATADFPFVRYRTGDIASLARTPCSCGRGLPALESVHGRSTDFIRTPQGNAMHALALIYEVRDKPGVRAFKFIQSEDLSLELQIVADAAWTHEAEKLVRDAVLARVGPGARLRISRLTQIPPEQSGKYRYVVSHAHAGSALPTNSTRSGT